MLSCYYYYYYILVRPGDSNRFTSQTPVFFVLPQPKDDATATNQIGITSRAYVNVSISRLKETGLLTRSNH